MPIERQNQKGHPSQSGFTLVELMVVVAVVGILAIVAAPSMSTLLNSNKVSAAAGELTTALQAARSEAVRRNARVTVCASADGATCVASTSWTAGWIAHGNDNATDTDEVIRSDAPTGSVQVSSSVNEIVFRPSGIIDAQAAVCITSASDPSEQRELTVMISGVISTDKVCD